MLLSPGLFLQEAYLVCQLPQEALPTELFPPSVTRLVGMASEMCVTVAGAACPLPDWELFVWGAGLGSPPPRSPLVLNTSPELPKWC